MGLLSGPRGRLYEDNGITPTEGHPLDRGLQFVNGFPTTNGGGGAAGGGGGIKPPGGGAPPPNDPGAGVTDDVRNVENEINKRIGGGGNVLDWFKDPANLAGLAGMIAAIAGGRNQGIDPTQAAQLDQLRRIQAITEAKMRRVDPLHQAVTGLAFSRLPVSARQGITLNNVPLPPEQT